MTKVKVIMNWDNNREETIEVKTNAIAKAEAAMGNTVELEAQVKEAVEKKYGIYDVKEFVILD